MNAWIIALSTSIVVSTAEWLTMREGGKVFLTQVKNWWLYHTEISTQV